MVRVNASILSSCYFMKNNFIVILRQLPIQDVFLSSTLLRIYQKIYLLWTLSFPHDLREKKWSSNMRNSKLFACLNVKFCRDGCEPGSALITEEHMVFGLNEQENIL